MIHNLFLIPVPVKLFTFAISTGGHDLPDRMPESGLDIAIGIKIPGPHAVHPVIDMKLAVITLINGWKASMIYFIYGNRFSFPALTASFIPS